MADDPFAQWSIDPGYYPERGGDAAKLRFLPHYAILAPSGHNTQPWRFRIEDDWVDLIADRERRLPVVDPHDRELMNSCGATLTLLRTAMRRF